MYDADIQASPINFIHWQSPEIGTTNEPMSLFSIDIGRVRAINSITLAFDGKRDCWVIGKLDMGEFVPILYIHESVLETE